MQSLSAGVRTLLLGISLAAALLLIPGCADDSRAVSGGEEQEPLPAVELLYTEAFDLMGYRDEGTPFCVGFYRPVAPDGFHALGHYGQDGDGAPCGWMLVARELEPGALAEPLDYELIAGRPSSGCSFWRPIPPPGYVGLGSVAQAGAQKPDLDEVRCLREDLAAPGRLGKKIWPSYSWAGASARQIRPEDEDGIYIGSFSFAIPGPTSVCSCIRGESVRKYDLAREDVEDLVERYGPVLLFHPWEEHFPDDVEYVLDHGVSLAWGVVHDETDYGAFRVEEPDSVPTSGATLMGDVRHVEEYVRPYVSDPASFKYWLHIEDGLKPGDRARGESLIRLLPVNWLFTEIQFWSFYPFNGPGRAEFCAWSACCTDYQLKEVGRHFGDWEHVSLLIENATRELTAVYMSRHGSGQWFSRSGGAWSSGLRFSGTHPIVYSAYDSHAHYPDAGRHDYERIFEYDWEIGTTSVDLYDTTESGESFETFQPGSYRVISSALPGYEVTEPEWLAFRGRWGQYERLSDTANLPSCNVKVIPIPVYTYEEVGCGPSGPGMKTSWTDGDCSQAW
ncbi:MAG: Vps62-related protein [Planctomycetes bacterium]|nr:Vps62-related protein [Planctomycetota bacterium]